MKLKPSFLTLVLAALPLGASNVASVNVSTTLLGPLNLAVTQMPSFGQVIVVNGSLGGTITVAAKGGAFAGGAGGLAVPGSSSAVPLILSITPSASVAFGLTFDPGIQMTGPGDPINVTILEVAQNGTNLPFAADTGYTGTTDASGTTVLRVGASMAVSSNQVLGAYSGTFNVTVAYQ